MLLLILIFSLGVFYAYQWRIKPLQLQLKQLKQADVSTSTQTPKSRSTLKSSNNFYQLNSQALGYAHIAQYQLSKQQLKADCNVSQLLIYLDKLKRLDYGYSIKHLKLSVNATHTQLITTIGFKHA